MKGQGRRERWSGECRMASERDGCPLVSIDAMGGSGPQAGERCEADRRSGPGILGENGEIVQDSECGVF